MTTNNHPAHAPLTTHRLHQMRDILSKAAVQRDGGDIGYAMSDAVKLIDEVLAGSGQEPMAYQYREHNPANGMKTTWTTLDSFAYEILVADTDPETAEFRPLYTIPQPAPVVPDGYCIMPVTLTAENGAKRALSGEFSTTRDVTCPECDGDGCSDCDGKGDWNEDQIIDWPTIKLIYQKAVEVCAIPATQKQDK
ncbi:hypothetical protein Q0A17_06430 [Citrobacter sp. S2-9]|uniref:Molecular chaperone DnaJ n=1 Tax=Citrobacter enshiensis TaxID=2971264 RepID=A0ABT8PRT7_9ENTR|nr:hypothetical protein [Citrobacter enshiensis]MDN8599051.1 hypothetical protein [Citrobacter enshiensis]